MFAELRSKNSITDQKVVAEIIKFYNQFPELPETTLIDTTDVCETIKQLTESEIKSQQFITYAFPWRSPSRSLHYAFLRVDNDKKRIIILDAANHSSTTKLAYELITLVQTSYSIYLINDMTALQNDMESCFTFALYFMLIMPHLNMDVILENNDIIEGHRGLKLIPLKLLPPEIVFPCQSNTLWEEYSHLNIEGLPFFEEQRKVLNKLNNADGVNILPAMFTALTNPLLRYEMSNNIQSPDTISLSQTKTFFNTNHSPSLDTVQQAEFPKSKVLKG